MAGIEAFEPIDVGDAVAELQRRWNDNVPTIVVERADEPSAVAPDIGLVSLRQLNRIVRLDVANAAVVAEAGVPIGALRETIQAVGLWCPALRWLPDDESIGAAVAGGHGRRSRKYGAVVDYLLGSRFVCPAAGLTRHGGLAIKNATGYNLTNIVAGSRGTLAVIVEVILRLTPLPPHRFVLASGFGEISRALAAVRSIARCSLDQPADARLTRSLASVEAWADLMTSEGSILLEVEDADRETNQDVIEDLERRIATFGFDSRSVGVWPPRPTPAPFTTRRFALDPNVVEEVAQSIVTSVGGKVNGHVLAESTGGALEVSLDRDIGLFGTVDPRAAPGAVGEFRAALKTAFDPRGLLREAGEDLDSNDSSS